VCIIDDQKDASINHWKCRVPDQELARSLSDVRHPLSGRFRFSTHSSSHAGKRHGLPSKCRHMLAESRDDGF
jgi:hypothetical protein